MTVAILSITYHHFLHSRRHRGDSRFYKR